MEFTLASEEFLEEMEVTKTPATYKFYVAQVIALNRFFEGFEVHEIQRKDIVRYISYERKRNPKKTNATINKHILGLKLVYKHATGDKLEFSKLNETQKVIPIIEDEVIKSIFIHLGIRSRQYKEALRTYVLFRMLLDTGLRITEALALRLTDINFGTNTIHLKITKTKRERYAFFTDKTKELLLRMISEHKIVDHIFVNYKKNKPLVVNNVQLTCSRLRKTLNIQSSITPHRWRHTFATKFLQNGGDLETLRLLLGHTSLKTTQKYLHLDRSSLSNQYFKIFN